ncbi:LysR substrate-binding domain-containing protein [Verminephrobacter eiseniae]
MLCHPEAGSGGHYQIEAVLEGAAVAPKVADRVTSLGVMLTLVGAGYGVGFAIASQVQSLQRPGIAIRPLAGTPPKLSTYVLCRQGKPSGAVKRFIGRVKSMSAPADGALGA